MQRAGSKKKTDAQLALEKIQSLDGVKKYLIIDTEGIPLKWDGFGDDYKSVVQVAALVLSYTQKTFFRTELPKLLGNGEASPLTQFRLRTKEYEMLVAPGSSCTLIVFQKND